MKAGDFWSWGLVGIWYLSDIISLIESVILTSEFCTPPKDICCCFCAFPQQTIWWWKIGMTKWNTRENCGFEKQICMSLRLKQLIKVQGRRLWNRDFCEILGHLLIIMNTKLVGWVWGKFSAYLCCLCGRFIYKLCTLGSWWKHGTRSLDSPSFPWCFMGIFNMAYQGWDHESLRPTYPSELPMLLTSQSILPCQKSLRTMYFLRYRADYKQGLAPWGKGSSFSLFFFIVLPLFRLPPRPFHLALCPMNDSRIHLSGPKEEARLTRLHREVGEGLREQVRDVEGPRKENSWKPCQL